jgi:hypothetical protein
MLITVAVLTFSSLVYFAEKEEQNWTYVDSFWWGLLTITTVGYGKNFCRWMVLHLTRLQIFRLNTSSYFHLQFQLQKQIAILGLGGGSLLSPPS